VEYFNENQKVSKEIPEGEIEYKPPQEQDNKSASKKVQSAIKEMGAEKFQEKFNQLFEKNMVKKRDESYNDWFKSNDPLYQYDNITSTSGLGQAMNHIKQNISSIVQYKGVENMNSAYGGGNLYDEDDEPHSNGGQYVSCDPFGKLKYDDLRKVHKDQTVFAVSENDFAKVKQYNSMDHLQRERGSMVLTPIEKEKAERMIAEKERALQETMLAKKHAANLRTMEYTEKNKSIMSTFFQLTNG